MFLLLSFFLSFPQGNSLLCDSRNKNARVRLSSHAGVLWYGAQN